MSLRRVVGLCIVVIACLFGLKFLHLGVKYYLKHATEEIRLATHNAYAWVATPLDQTPPSAPQGLTGGAAPFVVSRVRYLMRAYRVRHEAPIFDSSGGNLIVVAASTHNDAILTPSDSYSNTWISLAGPTNSSHGAALRSQIWYAKNARVGPNHKFDMALSSPQSLVISIFVVRGASPSDPIDAASAIADDEGMESTTPTSPSITTTTANDLLIGFGKGSTEDDWSAGDGFMFEPFASSNFLVAESGLAAAPGAHNAIFKFSLAATWQAAVVAVRPAEGVSSPTPIRLAWHAATDNVKVAQYQIERCAEHSCPNFSQIGTSTETSFIDDHVAPETLYRYRVRAVDLASNVSSYSNVVGIDGEVGRN